MVGVVLIALVVLSFFAPPAGATFPGRNGDLLMTERDESHGFDHTARLLRIDPRSGRVTRNEICASLPSLGFPGPDCGGVGQPAASPRGDSVAFLAADAPGPPPWPTDLPKSVRVLPLTAGERRYVPVAGVGVPGELTVRWTPDLSFAVTAGGPRVLLAGPDGADRGTLASRAAQPDVSSDGRLAFVRRGNVYVKRPGAKARRLTRRGATQPSWSPRGRAIAFSRRGAIYTIPASGGRAREITRGVDPVWSPNGRQIAFFRAIPDPEYFGHDSTYLFSVNRATGRARMLSAEVIAVPDAIPPNGLDWQAIR